MGGKEVRRVVLAKLARDGSRLMADHERKGAMILQNIGHELKHNPPKILAKTRRKKGKAAANRQRDRDPVEQSPEAWRECLRGRFR